MKEDHGRYGKKFYYINQLLYHLNKLYREILDNSINIVAVEMCVCCKGVCVWCKCVVKVFMRYLRARLKDNHSNEGHQCEFYLLVPHRGLLNPIYVQRQVEGQGHWRIELKLCQNPYLQKFRKLEHMGLSNLAYLFPIVNCHILLVFKVEITWSEFCLQDLNKIIQL